MMTKYAGGPELTEILLMMSGLEPCRILDLGAGDGATVRSLRDQGFFAQGLDQEGNADVEAGDCLHCHYEDGSFDTVISEGVCYGSGQEAELWKEALRLLRKGGQFLLADVCFSNVKGHVQKLEEAGFQVNHVEDATVLWAEYGLLDQVEQVGGKGRCRYLLSICEKR